MTQTKYFQIFQYLAAWGVHAFTASAAFLGVLSLVKIYQHNYVHALLLMALTVIIDAIDGTFARLVNIKEVLPDIHGSLLDNIVDFLNYVIVPSVFFLVKPELLPPTVGFWLILGVTMSSAYQFCQTDAKTPDHFFKGFPCYWNFVLFYMIIFNTSTYCNAWILGILCVLIFVPIKYVYPSRLDYLLTSKYLKILMHLFSATYALSIMLILMQYPESPTLWMAISLSYVVIYILMSFYRTGILAFKKFNLFRK